MNKREKRLARNAEVRAANKKRLAALVGKPAFRTVVMSPKGNYDYANGETMKQTLEQLLLKHGIRGVADALAEIMQRYAKEEKTLLYDPSGFPGDDPVESSDLENAASIFRGDLW